MTLRLALDATSSIPSIALARRGALVASAVGAEPLLVLLRGALAAADLTLGKIEEVVVVHGPGSFTGVRVGVATARGLAQALGIPLRGVDSLAAMILQVPEPHVRAVVLVDALRGEWFRGEFERRDRVWHAIDGPRRCAASGIGLGAATGWIASSGAAAPSFAGDVPPFPLAPLAPRLALGLERGELAPTLVSAAEPLYLRAPAATPPR